MRSARQSNRHLAYQALIDMLESGTLRAGQSITQKELVDLVGFPLAAIREAIPRLEADGLLTTLRHRGLLIANTDIKFIYNAYSLRKTLERDAIRAAAANSQHERIDALIERQKEISANIEAGDIADIQKKSYLLDKEIHFYIIDLLGNELVSHIYRTVMLRIRVASYGYSRETASDNKRTAGEHLAILEAIRSGDEEAALAAAMEHIDNSYRFAIGKSL